MHIINIHEAESQLSRLLEEVESGEDVVIARAGKPIVRMSRYRPLCTRIAPPGSMEGQAWLAEDFNAPLDDLFEAFGDEQ